MYKRQLQNVAMQNFESGSGGSVFDSEVLKCEESDQVGRGAKRHKSPSLITNEILFDLVFPSNIRTNNDFEKSVFALMGVQNARCLKSFQLTAGDWRNTD